VYDYFMEEFWMADYRYLVNAEDHSKDNAPRYLLALGMLRQ